MHGGVLVLVVLALVCGGSLITVGRRALGAHRGGGARKGPKKAGWLAHRREMRLERERHENAAAREDTRHEHKIAEQEHAAEKRAEAAASGRRGGNVFAKVVRLGDEPAEGPGGEPGARPPAPGGPGVPPPSSPSSPSSSPSGTPDPSPPSGTTRPPGSAAPGAPPPASPAPAAQPAPPQKPPARNETAPGPTAPGRQQSPTLEGVVMTVAQDNPGAMAVPGVEMIIEGAQALRRHMMAGNAKAKRAGVVGIALVADALAVTALAVSREMAEPGQHYGPEITDPLGMIAVHFSGASLGLSEVDGRLQAIIRAAEELAARGVQAPHHDQMTAR